MKRRFDILVDIADCRTLRSAKGNVNMVAFTGRCDCDFFHGTILPGGVDTQYFLTGQPGALSARYMLEGVDDEGSPARIFIENNGVHGENCTRPRILTDSPRLSFLEDCAWRGRIEGREGGVRICLEEV